MLITKEFVSILDTYVYQYYPNNSYGTSITMLVNHFTSAASRWAEALIQFNLSNILIPTPIMKATLRLYCTSGNTGYPYAISVYRVTSQWDESITWYTKPSVDGTPRATVTVSGTGFYEWDITNLVNDWLSGVANYGVLLDGGITASANYNKYFATREDADEAIRPRLILESSVRDDIYFIDMDDNKILSDVKGTSGKTLDFKQITAGQQSVIKTLKVINWTSSRVKDAIVSLQDVPIGDAVEISKYNNPFIPSPEVHFDGTFNTDSDIGTFYVRVKPGENSSGSKSFRIKAKATPI